MSKGDELRALVSERLAAVAEDIFVLFERMMTEYEEELRRSKEDTQRKQQLLDSAFNEQIPVSSPGSGLNQELTGTLQIKSELEEEMVKQEEELPALLPKCISVFVKTEESFQLQQRQTGHQQGPQGEDNSETEGHVQLSSVSDDNWRAPFSFLAAQLEAEADGDHYNQVQIRNRSLKLSPKRKSAPQTTVYSGHMSGAEGKAEGKRHQCPFCQKRFVSKHHFQLHIKVHTGEKPYSCPICKKAFVRKDHRDLHARSHTGEKPFGCSICKKAFVRKDHRDLHVRSHTGEKPFSCSDCDKTFAKKYNRDLHVRTHTGEKPYSCLVCKKTFALKCHLDQHNVTHTGDKPYSCTVCAKTFTRKHHLQTHMRTH